AEVVLPELGEDAQLHVGERADRQRHLLRDEPLDETVVFGAPHAVIDAAYAEQVERLPDVLGRPLLARVRDGEEALRPGAVEDGAELLGRVAGFPGVEPD